MIFLDTNLPVSSADHFNAAESHDLFSHLVESLGCSRQLKEDIAADRLVLAALGCCDEDFCAVEFAWDGGVAGDVGWGVGG